MKWIKKQKYKLLIGVLSIISCLTLFFGISKTYAYTTDSISYTLDTSNISETNNRVTITNNTNYIDIKLNDNSNYNSVVLNIPILNEYQIANNSQNYLLLNFDFLISSDNINYHSISIDQTYFSTGFSLYRTANSTSSDYRLCSMNKMYTQRGYTNNMYTAIINPDNNFSSIITNIYIRYIFSTIVNWYSSSNSFIFRIYNIDYAPSNKIGLQYYYDTYYAQIEQNYNNLLSDYEDLQSDYDTLEGNYNTLENDYDTLQEQYNETQSNLINSDRFYTYGIFAFIKNGVQTNNVVSGTYIRISYGDLNNTLQLIDIPLQSDLILEYYNGNKFDLKSFTYDYIESFRSSPFYDNVSYVNNVYLNIELFNNLSLDYIYMSPYDFDYQQEIFIRDTINNKSVRFYNLNTGNVPLIDKTSIQNQNESMTNFNTLYFTYIPYNSDVNDPFVEFNSLETALYNNGYNNGYNDGVEITSNRYNNEIQQLQNQYIDEVDSLQEQINTLTSTNTQLQLVVNALQNQVNSFDSSYNLNNLVWTIAGTPFESFKQIWNVNFFGINITELVTGFLTALIVLYIIKRFFR